MRPRKYDPIIDGAMRREALCEKTPECPSCHEQEQIQLSEWLSKPASWRCRMCHHRWRFEP